MADKKFRETDKFPHHEENFHCEEIDHNEIEIVQVRVECRKVLYEIDKVPFLFIFIRDRR